MRIEAIHTIQLFETGQYFLHQILNMNMNINLLSIGGMIYFDDLSVPVCPSQDKASTEENHRYRNQPSHSSYSSLNFCPYSVKNMRE